MRPWFHGWQPLGPVTETRFDEAVSIEEAMERVLTAIGRQPSAG